MHIRRHSSRHEPKQYLKIVCCHVLFIQFLKKYRFFFLSYTLQKKWHKYWFLVMKRNWHDEII